MVNEFRISHMSKYAVLLENSSESPSLERPQALKMKEQSWSHTQ